MSPLLGPSWEKNPAVANPTQNDGGCRGRGTCCVRRDSTEILERAPVSVGDGHGDARCTFSPTAGRAQATTRASPSQPVGWDGAGFRDKPRVVVQSPSRLVSRSSGAPTAKDRRASFDTACVDDTQTKCELLACLPPDRRALLQASKRGLVSGERESDLPLVSLVSLPSAQRTVDSCGFPSAIR